MLKTLAKRRFGYIDCVTVGLAAAFVMTAHPWLAGVVYILGLAASIALIPYEDEP